MASDSVKPITSRARVIWTAISVPVATIASVIGCFALAAVSQQVFFTVPYYVQYDYSQFFALSMLEYLTIFGVVPYVVAAGYWFSLRRMPGMSWWRITLSIAAINAVQMFVILPLGVTLQYALFPPYQPAGA